MKYILNELIFSVFFFEYVIDVLLGFTLRSLITETFSSLFLSLLHPILLLCRLLIILFYSTFDRLMYLCMNVCIYVVLIHVRSFLFSL